jgi:peptidoglycan/LPS O-acetylase OafA/YrhL
VDSRGDWDPEGCSIVRTRDRYIDFLRALALVRVVTYHTFGWTWLATVFPSIGIMLALGGALAAASLDRAGGAGNFLRKRLRRLLPPFWVFGAVMVAAMLVMGWRASGDDGGVPFSWSDVWLWIVPLADPPASDAGYEWALPMWYIRTYLWFLLLSPALLWLFRRWPVRLILLPALVLPLMVLGLVDFPDPYWDIICQLCVYGACWMLGFAHHDGKLRRLPLTRTLAGGAVLMALGLWHALTHQARYDGWNVDDNPLAGMLFFTGAVLVLLRIYPRFTWLERLPTLDALVTLVNSRAMTIYLWGNVAIALAPLALEHTGLGQFDTDDLRGMIVQYVAAWTLILAAVLLVGWVEDVAAGRRPQVLPWNRVGRPRDAVDPSVPADIAGSSVPGGTATGAVAANFVVDAEWPDAPEAPAGRHDRATDGSASTARAAGGD